MTLPAQWFCALLDSASDVYFRYEIAPAQRLVYVSQTVEALTGVSAAALQADPALCRAVVAPADRRLLVRLLRARRRTSVRVHLVRESLLIPVDVESVPIWQTRHIVAIEGRVRLASLSATAPATQGRRGGEDIEPPVQQRLASLMVEVHDLLHRVLPPEAAASAATATRVLRLGDLALDCDRFVVTEAGEPVPLTSREVQLLRYLLERRGRIVTRQQLLTDVWSYRYDGDDRTVDVHISRLRRKLPSLRGRLVAIRHVGYRLDDAAKTKVA